MAMNSKKQPWKFQITNSQDVEESELKAAAKRFSRYAFDMDMARDELFIQLVKMLPSSK